LWALRWAYSPSELTRRVLVLSFTTATPRPKPIPGPWLVLLWPGSGISSGLPSSPQSTSPGSTHTNTHMPRGFNPLNQIFKTNDAETAASVLARGTSSRAGSTCFAQAATLRDTLLRTYVPLALHAGRRFEAKSSTVRRPSTRVLPSTATPPLRSICIKRRCLSFLMCVPSLSWQKHRVFTMKIEKN
jgi:hypothetical protein